MPAITIGKNITSLKIQRQLNNSTQELGQSYQRLSSGLRITKAGDDAAGNAVAATLNLKSRVYSQGIRNLNDGISAISIAEGTLIQANQILMRVKELAEQAANGVYGSAQRNALDAESDALIDEYNRLLDSATFNGRKVLDGTFSDVKIQAGFGASESITVSIAQTTLTTTTATVGDGTFGTDNQGTINNFSVSEYVIADVNNDGFGDAIIGDGGAQDKLWIYLGMGDGTFDHNGLSYVGGNNGTATGVSDLDGDGDLDIVETAASTMNVFMNNGNGTFSALVSYVDGATSTEVTIGDVDGDGDKDIVTASSGAASNTNVFINNGNGTFVSRISYSGGNTPQSVTLADVNGDNRADIITGSSADSRMNVLLNNGNGTFAALAFYSAGSNTRETAAGDIDGDGDIDIVAASLGDDSLRVFLNNGNGTFAANTSYTGGDNNAMVFLTDVNGDSRLDMITGGAGVFDSNAYVLLNNGNGTFASRVQYSFHLGNGLMDMAIGDLNNDGVADITAASELDGEFNASLAGTTTGQVTSGSASLALSRFDLTTQSSARSALTDIDTAIDRVSTELGRIGSYQSRIDSALRSLQSKQLETENARVRITDVDVASESAALVRLQVRQQAATALLAQANLAPQIALDLLRS